MKKYRVIIIGGGAGGLFAASLLKGESYALIERGERFGKKLSSTGNGQGNITNVNMSAKHYFTDDKEKLSGLLSRFGNKELIAYLSSLGGIFSADERGRVYPSSRQASSVTDLLISSLDGDKYLLTRVTDIKKESGGYLIEATSDGKTLSFFAENVIIAAGGKAQKQFGTDGSFYDILKRLGHGVTALYPSLVQLKTDTEHIKTLRGIRADVKLTVRVGDKTIASTRGDVIFTDYGISGNAAFFISSYLAGLNSAEIDIEFLPDVPAEEIIKAVNIKLAGGYEKGELLSCIVNNQIGRAVIKRSDKTPRGIVAVLKKFTLKYIGTLGFDYAQVTRGGVPLKEVDENMQSAFNKNLYICGEALNVDGECGGYNLQFAFSSAYAAATTIKERLK